jgi:cell wall-associated NlpC family hydrolase
MKKVLFLLVFLFLICSQAQAQRLHDGDIIFQTSRSAQSTAIRLATGSPYTHVGILFQKKGGLYVLEAVEPVKYTPLALWIKQGTGGHYVVKRLRNAGRLLTPKRIRALRREAELFLGRHYDLYFGWSDKRIYCSELVWKAYKRALGVKVGVPQKLREFNLSSNVVRQKLRERYGSHIPLNETVISPGAIFDSKLLVTVMKK